MGCDIHSFAEVKRNGKWEKVGNHFILGDWEREYFKKDRGDNPFDWRNYSIFAFLADVRNSSNCKPIDDPRGLPGDVSSEVRGEHDNWGFTSHSSSYLLLRELLDFDYNQRYCSDESTKTYKEELGEFFFIRLKELEELGDPDEVRVVFWFDN